MKDRDDPTESAELFIRDFRRNVIHGIELCINLCGVVDTIFSIYFFDAFSQIQFKLRTF